VAELDIEAILETLVRGNVEFVVISAKSGRRSSHAGSRQARGASVV
jgi:hypothetical protein